MNYHSNSELSIRLFNPEYQESVKQLILDGLEEHWGTIDLNKNPDLNDIGLSYQNSFFITAWVDGILVGTGALITINEEEGQIVRMYVLKPYRRLGIGKCILNKLVDKAKSMGFQKIIIETTESWIEVKRFYIDYGFQITHYQNGDVYFELTLNSV
jgi:GNAT superfamily N-acetyltransferase